MSFELLQSLAEKFNIYLVLRCRYACEVLSQLCNVLYKIQQLYADKQYEEAEKLQPTALYLFEKLTREYGMLRTLYYVAYKYLLSNPKQIAFIGMPPVYAAMYLICKLIQQAPYYCEPGTS